MGNKGIVRAFVALWIGTGAGAGVSFADETTEEDPLARARNLGRAYYQNEHFAKAK